MAIRYRHRSRLLGDSLTARYDQAYYDKWYRHPKHRVKSPAELRRHAEFVLRLAEWVLGRPVHTVLDVGCGEGQWQPQLKRMRPSLHYDGVDPSEYAIQRFGTRRGLQWGGIEDLDRLALREKYDLVICCGMLNYLPTTTLSGGLSQVSRRTGGIAYLELFTNADAFEGDISWPPPQSAPWYRRVIRRAGLHPIGMHGYVPAAHRDRVSTLERL